MAPRRWREAIESQHDAQRLRSNEAKEEKVVRKQVSHLRTSIPDGRPKVKGRGRVLGAKRGNRAI
jgi:hypothetical protein